MARKSQIQAMGCNEKIAKLKRRITSIEAKLDTGLSSATNDGITGTYDHDALRAQRRELIAELEELELDNTYGHNGGFRRVRMPW